VNNESMNHRTQPFCRKHTKLIELFIRLRYECANVPRTIIIIDQFIYNHHNFVDAFIVFIINKLEIKCISCFQIKKEKNDRQMKGNGI
jgi:hypothetical protein